MPIYLRYGERMPGKDNIEIISEPTEEYPLPKISELTNEEKEMIGEMQSIIRKYNQNGKIVQLEISYDDIKHIKPGSQPLLRYICFKRCVPTPPTPYRPYPGLTCFFECKLIGPSSTIPSTR